MAVLTATDRSGPSPDLSVVVVAFNSAGYLPALLDSLEAQDLEVAGRVARIEVIVVDNDSPDEAPEAIEEACGSRARLVRAGSNLGYAAANNLGFSEARGSWHVVSNPDLVLASGALSALVRALEADPALAIVQPAASLDVGGELLHQPIEPLDPWLDALDASARTEDAIARHRARLRSRHAAKAWFGRDGVAMDALSGCFFLARRATFEAEGLFDPEYPLYFEDLDLFRRFHQRGLGLGYVPSARVAHFWSRSSMTRPDEARKRHERGALRYFETWFGEAAARAHRHGLERAEARSRDEVCPWPFEDLVAADGPPMLPLAELEGRHVEVAVGPRFAMVALLVHASGGDHRFPSDAWAAFPPIPLWVRVVETRSGETERVWRITRS